MSGVLVLGRRPEIEIQAKKGLKRGPDLWDALHSIASAIHEGRLSHGVLAVAADSSRQDKEPVANWRLPAR